VVRLERKRHPFLFDGLRAGVALWGHLLDVACVAHDTAGHFVKLSVNKPGTAGAAFEAVGVPASVPVLEIANTWSDPLLAPLTLPDWFRAVRTDYVVVDDKVALFDEIFPASLANEALSVEMLPFHRQLLPVYTDGLLTPVTIQGVLPEASIAEDLSLVSRGRLSDELVVTLVTAKVLLVPILPGRFGEMGGKNHLLMEKT
jgi:hypothetical protein